MTPRFALWAFLAWLGITVMWWSLAFAPLPVPPEWLATARSVCFGTQANGLPEAWGWATLIASPLAMLGFLVGVWGEELKLAFSRLAEARVGVVVIAAIALVPSVGLAWVGGRVVEARRIDTSYELSTLPEELPAHYPRRTERAPELGLVDQHGTVLELDDLEGRPVFMTFAFAHCKTICPVVVETVKRAAAEARDLDPEVIVVTLDPWRDTPSSLPSLVEAWRLGEMPRVRVLSGPVEEVLTVLDAWNMPHDRDPKTGDVAHPALVHVLGPDGSLAYTFNGPPASWVVEAGRRVAG